MSKINEFILTVQKAVYKVKRTQENEHLKSKYADLEDVLELLNPFFNEHSVLVDHRLDNNGSGWQLCTTLFIGDESRTWTFPLLGYDSKTPMQSLGSAVTYARRYTLKNIFKLVDSDDDANAVTPSGQPSKAARKSEVEKMLRAFASLHVSKSEVESIVQTDVDKFTLEDMENLHKVFVAIKGGKKKKEDYISGEAEWQE